MGVLTSKPNLTVETLDNTDPWWRDDQHSPLFRVRTTYLWTLEGPSRSLEHFILNHLLNHRKTVHPSSSFSSLIPVLTVVLVWTSTGNHFGFYDSHVRILKIFDVGEQYNTENVSRCWERMKEALRGYVLSETFSTCGRSTRLYTNQFILISIKRRLIIPWAPQKICTFTDLLPS